jgi:hypothetical protein
MVTIKFGFDEALPILLPCEIHPFFLTHPVPTNSVNTDGQPFKCQAINNSLSLETPFLKAFLKFTFLWQMPVLCPEVRIKLMNEFLAYVTEKKG